MAIINIIYVVMLIFGILQIILFFKLWGMTNDIRSMREQSSANNKEMEYYIKSVNEHLRKIENAITENQDKNKE